MEGQTLPRRSKHKPLIGNIYPLGWLREEWFLGFSGGTCLVFLLQRNSICPAPDRLGWRSSSCGCL